ncbi:PREDICTED: uncharacterized protein LOC104805503 [Tarenaya hassleriana]|uniref:uncharacterized protein LOC104805503 n=1 Tax=Tarenaya hassleriana TaxID=28532 RepID=UPI00053C0A0B|nr:PREDICTED: uncharacterized protein LOC104805503 [Tarenaya hassleriana]
MIHKRPYDGEDVYNIACKHLRHWDSVDHFGPIIDIVPENNGYPVSFSSGDDSSGRRSQGDERPSNDLVKMANECGAGTSGQGSKACWMENDIVGCDLDSLKGFALSFFPECFAQTDQPASSSTEEFPSPKLGPEHQADVPDWCPLGDGADCSYEERLIGTCVIPMPSLDSVSDNVCQRYKQADECVCPDHDSVTCVRQHVAKAREVLKSELGDDAFEALGFNEMGETVSVTWIEEEDLFHEVVRTNPARSGKNFLVQLLEVFPTRTKKDLVSYYFNVFMLRRRMNQNRCLPLHIDSDDDGCQIPDDDHKDEFMLDSLTGQHDDAIPHQDAASASVCNVKPLDETEGSITEDQKDSSVSSEIRKDEQEPL